jgi:ribosomal peptide maturation radical SAM protein 1
MEKANFENLSGGADAIILVPPFAGTERPSLSAHILQACCAERGLNVKIAYANLAVAAEMGEEVYRRFWAITEGMFAERFFSSVAFRLPFQDDYIRDLKSHIAENDLTFRNIKSEVTRRDLERLESFWRELPVWLDTFVGELLKSPCPVIGCTSSFEQLSASFAFLSCIKQHNKEIITVLGGANCEGEMGTGLLSVGDCIDYVFSGESEETFPLFLESVLKRQRPKERVIRPKSCESLDTIPPPKYSDYYWQHNQYLPKSSIYKDYEMYLPYETSRGCFWAQTRKCTFCGLNGMNLNYRVKSEQKVVTELKELLQEHPSRKVAMSDTTFPPAYFRKLVFMLSEELLGLNIMYEIRPKITFEQMLSLRRAGILQLQPGIEALSTSLLSRINKGSTVRDNIMFLRYAASLGIRSYWNLLISVPGDLQVEYEETLGTLNFIQHLEPPRIISPILIERFSEYYDFPKRFGIRNLRPARAYYSWLPEHADISKIAYHFIGEFEHFSSEENEIMQQIISVVKKWKKAWLSASPFRCELVKVASDKYLLVDTRGLTDGSSVQSLSLEQAKAALTDRPKYQRSCRESDLGEAETKWALERHLILDLDGWYVSLVTASPDLIMEWQAGTSSLKNGPPIM